MGLTLSAQAGEARMRAIVTGAGFTRFRRAAQTPFNQVFEARPCADADFLTINVIPEPQTYALMIAGLGLVGACVRYRNRR